MRAISAIVFFVSSFGFMSTTVGAEPAPPIEWIRQFGTSSTDRGQAVASDGLGGIYITGYAYGNLGGSYAGFADAFVRKYDSAGAVLWTRQMGTSDNDTPESISADASGNVYVTGTTFGNLAASPAGLADAFLLKYDSGGTLQWSRQFGTPFTELGRDVFADSQGNIYTTGITEFGSFGGVNAGGGDAFIRKFDSAGNHLWTRQYGTSEYDFGNGIAADAAGNVYVTGNTNIYADTAAVVDDDAFLIKYDSAGNLVWTRSIKPNDFIDGNDVVVKGNDIYVVGSILVDNHWDAFITRYNTNGVVQSYVQWGVSTYDDIAYDVATDPQGRLVVTGNTDGSLGAANAGANDTFVTKFDSSLSILWSTQFGTSTTDLGNGIATDNVGNIYVAGATFGTLGGSSAGSFDAFLVKLQVVPEPGSVALMFGACVSFFPVFPRKALRRLC